MSAKTGKPKRQRHHTHWLQKFPKQLARIPIALRRIIAEYALPPSPSSKVGASRNNQQIWKRLPAQIWKWFREWRLLNYPLIFQTHMFNLCEVDWKNQPTALSPLWIQEHLYGERDIDLLDEYLTYWTPLGVESSNKNRGGLWAIMDQVCRGDRDPQTPMVLMQRFRPHILTHGVSPCPGWRHWCFITICSVGHPDMLDELQQWWNFTVHDLFDVKRYDGAPNFDREGPLSRCCRSRPFIGWLERIRLLWNLTKSDILPELFDVLSYAVDGSPWRGLTRIDILLDLRCHWNVQEEDLWPLWDKLRVDPSVLPTIDILWPRLLTHPAFSNQSVKKSLC